MNGKELIGKKFGKLVVQEYAGLNKRYDRLWLCLCDCGNQKIVKGHNLTIGKTRSCGCIKTGPQRDRLEGQKFARLTVVEYAGADKWRDSIYKCVCECGKVLFVLMEALKTGNTKSCGCLKVENDNDRFGEKNPFYNPNLSPEDRIKRRLIGGNKIWAIAVKQRDNFICQVCGVKKGIKFVSHHIESYHCNPDLRRVVSNGICLCVLCHDSFHKKYRRRNNTRAQFEEFLEWKQTKLGVN